MTRILLILFYLAVFVTVKAQNWPKLEGYDYGNTPTNYREAMDIGDSAAKVGDYEKAINYYFAAEAFDPTKKDSVKIKVNLAFVAIRNLKDEAISSKLAAIREKKKAENATKIAIKNADEALSYELIWKARNLVDKDPTLALRLAEEAYKINGQDATIKQEQYRIYNENTFYKVIGSNDTNEFLIGDEPYQIDGNYEFISSNGTNEFLIGDEPYQIDGNLIKAIQNTNEIRNQVTPDHVKTLTFEVKDNNNNKRWKAILEEDGKESKEIDICEYQIDEQVQGVDIPSVFYEPFYEWSPDRKMILVELSRFSNKQERYIVSYKLFYLREEKATYDNIIDSLRNTIKNKFNDKRIESTLRDSLIRSELNVAIDNALKLNEANLSLFSENDAIFSMFSPEGNSILSISIDGTVQLKDFKGDVLSKFIGHNGKVNAIGFSRNGEAIITREDDGTLRLWDLKGFATKKVLKHENKVSTVAISRKNLVATGSDDKTIKLWNANGDSLKVFEGHNEPVWALAFSSNGKYLISGTIKGAMKLWDVEKKEFIRDFPGHNSEIHAVAFSPTKDEILSSSHDGKLRLWNLEGDTILEFGDSYFGKIHSAVFSPNGKYILSGHWPPAGVVLWNVDGEPKNSFSLEDEYGNGVNSVSFSPNSELMLYGTWNGKVFIRNFNGDLILESEYKGAVNSVAFSPLGYSFVAAIQEAKSFNIQDLQGITSQEMIGHTEQLDAVAFSNDGSFLVTGSTDNTAIIWQVNRPLEDFLENGNVERLSDLNKQLTHQQKTEYGIIDLLSRIEEKKYHNK